MVDGDFIMCLAGKMRSMNKLESSIRCLINHTFDFKADAMSSLKQISRRHNLDGELIKLSGDERLWFGVGMERLPWF